MPAHKHVATVRAIAIGGKLRQVRETRGLTLDDVAEMLGDGWNRHKLGRIEQAKTRSTTTTATVTQLLDLYGVDSGLREALLKLVRDAWRRGWWTDYADIFQGSFVALEDQASRIRSWQPQLIPGLLQTEAYGRAIIRAALPDLEPAEVDQRWHARLNRQALLTREAAAPNLEVVLDEAVLERPVGGREVMRAQLRHLLDRAKLSHVDIRVMPKRVGEHAGLEGPLVILSFPGGVHPDIVYVETFPGDAYMESTHEVARSNATMDRVQKDALSTHESTDLISRLVKE